MMTAKEVAEKLKSAQSIVVLSHMNPDPDAYGSSCGLALALREMDKKVIVVNESGILDRLAFIPGVGSVQNDLPDFKPDLYCIVDCGELKRVGDKLIEKCQALHEVINIDHHISNNHFGTMNYVVTSACSTSELIVRILQAGNIKISKDVASALFAGISGDTGSFRYSNTTASVFETARVLVDAGAEPGKIAGYLYSQVRRQSMLVSSAALSATQFYSDGRLAWIEVPRSLADKFGADREDTEGVVERGRDIEGVEIACFIREEEGLWKISMRSRAEAHNVSQIAQSFGGGGHAMAAAFRWRGTVEDLRRELRAALEDLIAQVNAKK